MNRTLSSLRRMIVAVASCAAAFAVQAEELPASELDPGAAADSGADQVLAGRKLDDASLAEWRGGADTHYSNLRATGTVSEVAVSEVVTGHNLITDGALAGASGLPMVVQNSGNGVLIQNAVIVNVEMN